MSKQIKKVKDLTLEELNNFCDKQNSCQECFFQQNLCFNDDLADVLTKCFYKHNYEKVAVKEIEVHNGN